MEIVRSLNQHFARLHELSHALVQAVPADRLYWQPTPELSRTLLVYSCGEHLLRAAAAVEQTFGGITANLWDDPFEWTLPETLPTPQHVAEYLNEAEATRIRAFGFIHSDAEFAKRIATPTGETRTLFSLTVETLARASHHQGRAYATFRLFSEARLPNV